MSDNPFDFLGGFPRPKPPEAPKVTPELLDRYLKSLATPVKAPSAETPAVPEKSVLEKIIEATGLVRKAISEGKLNKGLQLQWVVRVRNGLQQLCGTKHPLLTTLAGWRAEIEKAPLSVEEFIGRVAQVEHLLSVFGASNPSGSFAATSRASIQPTTKSVFVIHGHDELNLHRLSQMVRDDFKLTPEVLLDKPGKSATTIEKFEQYAERCSYAVALFTADDLIRAKNGDEYWQARPNVIFETGWFVGRLGKERVLILLQDRVSIYSDFDGVNRVQFANDVRDKYRAIQGEFEAAKLL